MYKLDFDLDQLQKSLKKKALLAQETLQSLAKKTNTAKAQDLVRLVLEKGNLTQEEGKKKVEQILVKAKEVGTDLEKKVEEGKSKLFQFLQIPSSDELDKVSKKVDKLSKKIDELGKKTKSK